MAGTEKYTADFKTYTSHVNEPAVAQIVRHLGIALRNRASSFVASNDPEELKRVRDSWLKKKPRLSGAEGAVGVAAPYVAPLPLQPKLTVSFRRSRNCQNPACG
jgi:hypothetical protein